MIGEFTYSRHRPTNPEREIMKWVENRRKQMDTNYRKQVIELAEWSSKEYDSLPQERISNLDMFKTGLSRAIVNHRLVMQYENPSAAIYKAVEDSDQYRVDILTQTDKYDQEISRFVAMRQQLDRLADIEGVAIGEVGWRETMDGPVTIGDFSTSLQPRKIKDFYWDEAGIFLNGNSAYTCNDGATSQVYSMTQFRNEFESKKKFKNVTAVLPNKAKPTEEVWSDDWEEGRYSTDGDYVHVFTIKIKQFRENNKFVDKEFVVANSQLIYEGPMQEPEISPGVKWLPWFKLDGIATGNFAGIGIPALIRHPQEALDRMLTMAEAQAELAVNPVLFYQTTGEILPDTIDYFPGAAYPYKGTGNGITNDLHFFQQPDITNGATYIIDKMVEFMTVVTGVDISALLDTGSELAIQTQNKREIQEKILKMSILWNETHGLADLARLRLAYIQSKYPSVRVKQIDGPNGVETQVDFPKIKVNGFNVEKGHVNGKSINRLVESPGAYSSLSVRPEDLRFNVDVIIESSQMASGSDTVKQNKWEKMLDNLARVPGVEQTIDPEKISKNTVKFGGFKPSDALVDQLREPKDDTHPARKEFKAILASDAIPFEPIMPDSYEPEDYLFIFRDMMKLPEYKKAPSRIKQLINERLQLHVMNFSDPYFKDKQKLQKDAEITQQVSQDRAEGATLKAIGGSNEQPTDLASRTRSEAAKIGDATKKAKESL